MFNQLFNLTLNILTLGYVKHLEFHEILIRFSIKLPRLQKQAKSISNDVLNSLGINNDSSLLHVSVIDKSKHQTSISEMDLDAFYGELNLFKPCFFKSYYKIIIDEFNSLNPNAKNKDNDLIILQKYLSDILKTLNYILQDLNIFYSII